MNAISKENFLSTNACGICLTPSDSINHLDHLAVLSYILDVPLMTDEEALSSAIKKYYPQVKQLYIARHEEVLARLASLYDVLFVSSAHYRIEMQHLFDLLFKKRMLFWYCPHGNSDKSLDHFKDQELAFIYGKQMEERLKKERIPFLLKNAVRTGNYRLAFYLLFQDFYDNIIEKEVFSHFAKQQPVILYAPTWEDLENSSSLFDYSLLLLKDLPDDMNLIVKLHPWLEYKNPGFIYFLQEKYRNRENVKILSHYPLVFPILNRVDIYLGDFSSIGYDFLYFDRPMFFLDSPKRVMRSSSDALHRCGTLIKPNPSQIIFSFIQSHLKQEQTKSKERQNLYRYAFGEKRSLTDIREETFYKASKYLQKSELL